MRSASSVSARISSRISARPRASSGSAAANCSPAPRRRRVDHRARRQHERHRARRCCRSRRSRRSASRPSCWRSRRRRIAMSVLAGSGPRRARAGPARRLTWPSTVPGPHAHGAPPSSSTSSRCQWRRTSTRMPSVWRLPVEAGAAGAERRPACPLARERHQPCDVAGVARHRHRLGDQAVRARVRGVADQVRRAGVSTRSAPSSADELRAQRLGRARRNPVRRAGRVRGSARARVRAMSARAGPLAQSHMPGATCDLHEPRPVLHRDRRRGAPRAAPRALLTSTDGHAVAAARSRRCRARAGRARARP